MTNILIINNNRLNRRRIRKTILYSHNVLYLHNDFTVLELKSTETTTGTIETEKPNQPVLNLCLYGTDGFETLGRMRPNSSIKKQPVILLSESQYRINSAQPSETEAEGYPVKAHSLQGNRAMATTLCTCSMIAA